MGRKIASGVITNSQGTGSIAVNGNTIESVISNSDITFDASGTGSTVSTKVTKITDNVVSNSVSSGSVVTTGGIGITGNLVLAGTIGTVTSIVAPIGVDPATPSTGTFTAVAASGLVTLTQSQDFVVAKTSASGVVIHDFTESNIWEHSSITSNFTINLVNTPTTNNRTITISLILTQGGTPYYATALQINGVSQTVRWSTVTSNFTPTANRKEVQTFTLIRAGSSWTATTQLLSYGETVGLSRANPATSANAILSAIPTASSGYYWISPPGSGAPYYVYCDMSTDGGGWMLMINARSNNGGQYYSNNDYGFSTIDGNPNVVEYQKATTSMFGVDKINQFLSIPGTKWTRIVPLRGYGAPQLNAPFTGLYQRLGTLTTYRWPGTANDCSNRATLVSSADTAWVLTQYKNWSDVQASSDAQVGTYTGGNHYYPTTYAGAHQNFWKGDSDGIRFSADFRSESYSGLTLVTGYTQNLCSGHFWIKVT